MLHSSYVFSWDPKAKTFEPSGSGGIKSVGTWLLPP